jgi:predicted ATPase
MVQQTGEAYYAAELHRLQGELLLQQDGANAAQADRCFEQALAIARHQQAKSLGLRAAVSLSRLWQQHGKQTEARQLLSNIYDWSGVTQRR